MSGLRLDKWLWFARVARTRSLAAKLCLKGQVMLAGALMQKPAHHVHIGDEITVRQGRLIRHLTVRALGARRGPPAEARRLFDEEQHAAPGESAAWEPLLQEESMKES
jgi:ribosome-associated heat shock protein Hsp15